MLAIKWVSTVQKKWVCFTSLFLVALLLQGCAFFEPAPVPPIYLKEINFTMDVDANNNSATSIDLLLIYDANMLKVLLEAEAKDYYAIAKQVRQDYPDLADILHWELTPGQVIKNYPIKLRSGFLSGTKPQGAILFANYYAPGPHRIRLGSSKVMHVHLKSTDFCIVEQGCFATPVGPEAQSQVMKSNFDFVSVKASDPTSSIAAVEAAKAAQASKGAGENAKKFAEQVAKFKPM